jgi:hypothetical protein
LKRWQPRSDNSLEIYRFAEDLKGCRAPLIAGYFNVKRIIYKGTAKGFILKVSKAKYLKTENRKWLIFYVFAQFVFFALFAGIIPLTFNDTSSFLENIRDPQGLVSLLAIPLTIMLEGLISSDNKARIVFLRIKNCMPGSRAFSKIAVNDHRVDLDKLKLQYPEGLPDDPEIQNKAWYQLYRKHSDKLRVIEAHKAFLLTRDFTALTVVFIPISLAAHLIWGTPWPGIFRHILLLVGFLIFMIVSAQTYGIRFVANVLVEATLR